MVLVSTQPQQRVSASALGILLLCISLGLPSQASAEVRPGAIELGLFGGYWDGSRNVDSAAQFGLSAGYNLSRVFSLELNHSFVPTQAVLADQLTAASPAKEDVTLQQGALNFQINLAAGSFVPFFNLGGGWLITPDGAAIAADVGFGARYFITHDLAARFGLFMWMSDLDLRAENYDHFTLSVGISQSIAGDRDIDKDGVINPDDSCPTIAEDIDQFEDGDGCPDEDNDGDGIKDDEDQCRDEKEDMDGDEDEDGCPDLDKDGDKVLDEVDLCKEQPEDLDGFKDEDGCPDPDNDEDGIEDSKDQCPNEKESVNGFQDEDGCPEKDTDGDGIFDSVDQCDSKKETFNGLNDEDGCPDELSPEISGMIGPREEITFKKKANKFDKIQKVKEQLKPLADQLKMEPLKIRLSIDSGAGEGLDGEEQSKLDMERAQLIQSLLVELGVPEGQMTTVPDDEKAPVTVDAQQAKRKRGAMLVISPWVIEPVYKVQKEEKSSKGIRKQEAEGKGDPKVLLVP